MSKKATAMKPAGQSDDYFLTQLRRRGFQPVTYTFTFLL